MEARRVLNFELSPHSKLVPRDAVLPPTGPVSASACGVALRYGASAGNSIRAMSFCGASTVILVGCAPPVFIVISRL